MDDEIRDIYEAEIRRGQDSITLTSGGLFPTRLLWDTGAEMYDGFYDPGEPPPYHVLDSRRGEPRWPEDRETPTPKEAYADGWIGYCEQTDNPYTDDELAHQWDEGFTDAEDFFGGEPCQ